MVANFAPVVGCSGASRCAGAFWLALIKPAPDVHEAHECKIS